MTLLYFGNYNPMVICLISYRLGGFEDNLGMSVSYHEERKKVLQYLCDVMSTCSYLAMAMKMQVTHPITAKRIAQLYPK